MSLTLVETKGRVRANVMAEGRERGRLEDMKQTWHRERLEVSVVEKAVGLARKLALKPWDSTLENSWIFWSSSCLLHEARKQSEMQKVLSPMWKSTCVSVTPQRWLKATLLRQNK